MHSVAGAMKIRAKLNAGQVEVKVLMAHEMETGQRRTQEGSLVPAWFIQRVVAKCNNKVVLQANWGAAVSKNPFLSFSFKSAKVGDVLEVTWTDNQGNSKTGAVQVT